MAVPRATMDFFAAQAAARRHTFVLVLLFALAIALTVALADTAISLALSLTGDHVARGAQVVAGQDLDAVGAWSVHFGGLLLPVAGAVLAVVAVGYGWHAVQLGGDGGDAVARMMGGRPVDRLTQDPGEKRAVNVLEEMALAAAIPVPRLYVMDGETGINAFAAGRNPEEAVVAVTRGALGQLSRDELQGVFAHELSHVLNADMRLNLRLMALIGGLTALALVGRILVRYTGSTNSSWGTSSRRKSGGSAIVLVGVGLLLAGAIGSFFARLIRLAVSREREYLADAAAVQFTRNPDGLAGALRKIAAAGSALQTAHAPEAAHLFFANGVGGFLAGFLSTHPPIDERIRRLQAVPLGTAAPRAAPAPGPSLASPPGSAAAIGLAAVAAVGRPTPEHLEAAASVLAAFPAALVEAAREPFAARALCLALLLDADPALRSRQLAAVSDPELGAETARVAAEVAGIARAQRLALLDLALPALDGLSPDQARTVVRDLAALALADGRLTLHEWALQRLVRRRLRPQLGERVAAPRMRALEQVEVEALELLSALAWTGQRDPEVAQAALDAGTEAVGVGGRWRLLPRDRFTAPRLDATLARLDEATPPLKARLVAGAAVTVLADGRVTLAEAEMLRAVAGSLGLPMPAIPEVEGPAAETAA
jgi:Zn-dependent protease with chaperone function